MSIAALHLILVLGWLQAPDPSDSARSILDRAETLYYEARFEDSVELLLPLERRLGADPERTGERIETKLQLALGYIGLNEPEEAESRFAELLELDPSYTLDRRMYAPKVVTLFDQARARFEASACRQMCRVAGRQLELQDAEGLLASVESAPDCGCMTATALDAADFFFDRGLDWYRTADYPRAFEDLRYALEFNGDHDSAGVYLGWTEDALERETARALGDWRRQFESGEYAAAKASYERLRAAGAPGGAEADLARVRTEYSDAAAPLLESWNRACAARDLTALNQAEGRLNLLLPDSMAAEGQARPTTCAVEGCFQVSTDFALRRIASRVSPQFSLASRSGAPTLVRARIRIGEGGDTTVLDIEGGSPAIDRSLRTALEGWRFEPIVIGDDSHCAETELSFLVGG